MNRDHQRVTKNTLMLYTRQILILLTSLYTVRIILLTLGETDYGLYTVVAGIVTMFSVFSGAMSSACQRFFSFDLGKKDNAHLKNVFSMTLLIYGAMTLLAAMLMESVGLWYIIRVLSIPQGKETAVLLIYEFSVGALCCTILTAPYMALIIAYEEMNVYALISVAEALLKLGVAFAVRRFSGDKLILYGALTSLSTVAVSMCYIIYCRARYKTCQFCFYWNHELFRKIFSFTGWSMFGAAVGTFKIQLVNVVLNQYFNPAIVAARGIATSVNTAVSSFSQSFSMAMKPVIIKEYAAERYDRVNRSVCSAAKLTFLLMYIFILPLGLEMEFVLTLWLGTVPEGAVRFTILTLVDALVDSASYPLMTAAQATGKIRLYQAVIGGIHLMNFPLSWFAVRSGADAQSIFVIAIILTALAFAARLLILPRLMAYDVKFFLKETVLPLMTATLITILPPYIVTVSIEQCFARIAATTTVSLACTGIVFWKVAASEEERNLVIQYLKGRMKRKI